MCRAGMVLTAYHAHRDATRAAAAGALRAKRAEEMRACGVPLQTTPVKVMRRVWRERVLGAETTAYLAVSGIDEASGRVSKPQLQDMLVALRFLPTVRAWV